MRLRTRPPLLTYLLLRQRLPLGNSRFLRFFGGSPPQSGFLMMVVFVMSLPPPRRPQVRT